jgi:dihydrofolate synthase/folylpolyglutamate synthase
MHTSTMAESAKRAEQALARLAALHPKLIDLGLERSFALLQKLGDPHLHLPPTIHVAGTNGKGSVIAFLRALAEAGGVTTHVYSSPHLCRFNERIRLAGTLIDDAALADLLEEVEALNGTQQVTFFEVTTAAAMLAFSRHPADLLCLETGLGGALDSTNVLTAPLATIITPIARDHEHFLGTSLTGIAEQKAGIMRSGIPCFSAAQSSEVAATLQTCADKIGAPLYMAGRDFVISPQPDGGGCLTVSGTTTYFPRPGLAGPHQIDNAGLAFMALSSTGACAPDGITKATWPGRVQQLDKGTLATIWPYQPIWLDGAHNAHGATALAATLRTIHDGRWNVICGALNTRDPAEFLAPLTALAGHVACLTIPDQDASLSATAMSDAAKKLGMTASPAKTLAAAFDQLDQNAPVIICGSLYLAGHILWQNKTLPA